MTTENWKSKIFAVSILLFLAVMCIQPVSADSLGGTDVPIFSIPEKTTFYDTSKNAIMSVAASKIEIPEYLESTTNGNVLMSNSADTSKIYDLVCFDGIIPIRSDSVSVPLVIYGTEYIADLEKLTLGDENDGIDSYAGTLRGVADSNVVWTVDENNVLSGFVSYPGEHIVITPVQDLGAGVTSPVHAVYSEYDLDQSSASPGLCGVTEYDNQLSTQVQNQLSQNELTTTSSGTVYIDVLVVVDEESYSSNWITKAQGFIATANQDNCYGRDDSLVQLNPMFDSSKKSQMSAHPQHEIWPITTVKDCYPNSVLNSYGADICVYLGGYDIPNGFPDNGTIGLGGGRHAWVQTKGQDIISNGDDYFITHTLIHEVGHILGASHNEAYHWNLLLMPQETVMDEDYNGITISKLEFSSTAYDGDSDHNNAFHLRQNKTLVSSYI